MLLASITIGAVYWTATVVGNNDAYYETFTRAMDFAIDQAYGHVIDDVRTHSKK